jgi:conjugal transfer/entry exclusion protein
MTIESFQEFSTNELQYFRTDSEKLDAYWKRYIDSLFEDVSDLRLWQRSLQQRIQTFDRMKDGVCGPPCNRVAG